MRIPVIQRALPKRAGRLVALAAALSLCGALDAQAHARLVKSTPAAGSTVASAAEIRLEFSESVEPRFSGLTLTGSDGAAVPLDQAKVEAGQKNVLVVPINVPLAAGVFIVHWHAVAVDTHRTQGDFRFTVKP